LRHCLWFNFVKMEIQDSFYPTSRQEWRRWLEENHRSTKFVWLILYKANTGVPTISWSEAVDEALCFGWIDSQVKPIDHQKRRQYFCQRKPGSIWSKINKAKVQRLIAEGSMTVAGLEPIERAKQDGSWEILDAVEELIVPDDLAAALAAQPGASDFFAGLSKSTRKIALTSLVLAKRPETRQKRIAEIVAFSAKKEKPVRF